MGKHESPSDRSFANVSAPKEAAGGVARFAVLVFPFFPVGKKKRRADFSLKLSPNASSHSPPRRALR